MDLLQLIRNDHANIAEICREILGATGSGGRSRDRLFEELERQLEQHVEAADAVLLPVLERDERLRSDVAELERQHSEIRHRLDDLAGSWHKDSLEWTRGFNGLMRMIDRHLDLVERLLDNARSRLDPHQADDLRRAFEREKLAALQSQRWHVPAALIPARYGVSNQVALGVLAGVAAAAVIAATWSGRPSQPRSRGVARGYRAGGTVQQTYADGRRVYAPQPGTYDREDARKLMVAGLRNAHGLEQQAIEMLERNAERLESYPELKARVARHLEESRQQQRMVAQVLEELGESPSSLKDTVMGMAENVQMMVHAAAGDEVLKNAYTGYAFEHFEIASYKALIVMARAAGESRVERMAQDILRQEEEMAHWLEDHLPQIVSQYIVQMGSGQAKR